MRLEDYAQLIEAAKALRAEYAATDEYVEHSPTHKLLAAFDTALSSLEARPTSDLFCVHGVPLSQRCTSCNPPAPSTQAEVEPTIDEIGRAGSDVESRVWRINALIKRAVGVRVLVPCSRESESPDILDQTGKRLFMAFWGTHPPTPEATSAEEDRIYSLIEALCGMWNVWPRLLASRQPSVDRDAVVEECAAAIENGDLLEVLEGKPRMISETEAKLRTAEALTSAAALLRALKAPRAEAETPRPTETSEIGGWRIAKTSCMCNREDDGHGWAVLYNSRMVRCLGCLRDSIARPTRGFEEVERAFCEASDVSAGGLWRLRTNAPHVRAGLRAVMELYEGSTPPAHADEARYLSGQWNHHMANVSAELEEVKRRLTDLSQKVDALAKVYVPADADLQFRVEALERAVPGEEKT